MTKEEKVKKVITALTNGLKSDLCKDGYPESNIDELNSILITALCEIVNEPSEQTTSLKAEVESLQSQLAESQKRENFIAKISDKAQDINEQLLEKLAKAEADKVELLEFINVHEIEPCGKTLNKDGLLFRKPSKDGMSFTVIRLEEVLYEFHQIINKHGNNK
jgi:hypothetical protein